jgi:D-alanyl-D-alanine carboxypeptidase/D-alanyl-D-alanine-endopeptidase (penicillin-binding protein 4)
VVRRLMIGPRRLGSRRRPFGPLLLLLLLLVTTQLPVRGEAGVLLSYDTALQRAWDAALASPGVQSAAVSAYAVDLSDGRVLAAVHPDWRLTPGSLVKLYTSAEALAYLGPSFRYQTEVAVGGPSSPPTVYLIGGGDPWLEADGSLDLEHLARRLSERVRTVARVVGVSALFGGPSQPGIGWPWEDLPFDYTPRVAALTSERDEVAVEVRPGAEIGGAPIVTLNPGLRSILPPHAFLTVVDRARTVPAGRPDTLVVTRGLGSPVVTLRGAVPLGAAPVIDTLSLPHPALMTATLFSRLLARDGVHILHPPAVSYHAPPAGLSVVAVLPSRSLAHDLQVQNTFSVNLMAENLWHTVARVVAGDGSSLGAMAVESHFLAQHALPAPLLVDGSGLSPFDRMSAAEVVALLRYAAKTPWFPVFEHSLIHVGRTDQCSFLCGLMDGTPADGTVWLKTGSLANQWNYAGYARARDGHTIAFAILFDGLPRGRYFQAAAPAIDQMTEDVASWPDEPPGPLPPPRPAAPAFLRPLLPRRGSGVAFGASVVPVGGGAPSFSLHGETEMKASLAAPFFTVAAALLHLPAKLIGPTVTLQGTRSGSVVRGRLVLSAGQDLLLSEEDLDRLAAQIAALGIRTVTAGVLMRAGGAPSWLGEPWPPGIPWELLGTPSAPIAGRPQVDGGAVHILVQGMKGTAVPLVETVPAGLPVHLVDEARTGDGPPLSVSWQRGTTRFIVTGSIPPGARAELEIVPPDPVAVAAARFQDALQAHGVRVLGGGGSPVGKADGPVLVSLPGPSLDRVALAALAGDSGALLGLYGLLGQEAGSIVSGLAGQGASLPDPTGLGREDYADALAVARLLAEAPRSARLRPLAAFFAVPRRFRAPESALAAGYAEVGGRTYAYAVLTSGLPLAPTATGVPPELQAKPFP